MSDLQTIDLALLVTTRNGELVDLRPPIRLAHTLRRTALQQAEFGDNPLIHHCRLQEMVVNMQTSVRRHYGDLAADLFYAHLLFPAS